MRRLIASVHVTLDGVMGSPEDWSFQFFDEAAEQHSLDELRSADALLLGRITYEGFADYWPTATDAIADHMNALPKHVVSTTLEDLRWDNSHLISSDVVPQIAELKQQPGGDILLFASADLANALRPHALIDEYRIWVDPIVRGRGKRYFAEGDAPTVLQLVRTQPVGANGVVLTYTTSPSPAGAAA